MANLQLIKELLDKKNMSIEQLADKIGLKRGAVYNIIAGNSTKIETLENICTALAVPPSYFFSETIQPDYPPPKTDAPLTIISDLVQQNATLVKQVSDMIKMQDGLIQMQLLNSKTINNLSCMQGDTKLKKVSGATS
jgi:transcriptional regulator with XRE-family HTH domain